MNSPEKIFLLAFSRNQFLMFYPLYCTGYTLLQLILIINGSCVFRFVYLIKSFCNPQINTCIALSDIVRVVKNLNLLMHMFLAELNKGILYLCILALILYTNVLFSNLFFHIVLFICDFMVLNGPQVKGLVFLSARNL